jgi:hypothetical protein
METYSGDSSAVLVYEIRICHTNPEVNACADALGNMGCDHGLGLRVYEHGLGLRVYEQCPASLSSLLFMDVMWITTPIVISV